MPISLTVGDQAPLAINGLADLETLGAITSLILGAEFVGHLDQPISTLPANAQSTAIGYTGSPSWTVGDFTFGLTAGVTGKITINTSGTVLTYTDEFPTEIGVGLATTTPTATAPAVPDPAGTAYVTIEFDFQLGVNVAFAATFAPYGVSASVGDTNVVTVAFSKKCLPGDKLGDSIVAAFQSFVLPLHAETFAKLQVGDYLHYTYNGTLQVGLGASVGIDKVLYAGQTPAVPGTAGVLTVGGSIAPEVIAGAKLAFAFTYAGTFESLQWKTDANTGQLHLYKSKTQIKSADLNLGITLNTGAAASAGVTLGNVVTALLPSSAVTSIASTLVNDASGEVTKYVTDVNNKISSWLAPIASFNSALDFNITSTKQTFLLLDYTFDLGAAQFADAFGLAIGGKFVDALAVANGGVSIAVGSGLENFYSKKASITLNLFGTTTAAWSTNLINNSSLIYAGNNIFHLVAQVGRQNLWTINNSKREVDVYFAADAQLANGVVALNAVNLHILLQATNNASYGLYVAGLVGTLASGTASQALVNAIKTYAGEGDSTQFLHIVLPPSAYGRLTSSTLGHNTITNENNDIANYNAFAQACTDLKFTSPANQYFNAAYPPYAVWSTWIIAAVDAWPAPAGAVPDRRSSPDPTLEGPVDFLQQQYPGLGSMGAHQVGYFFEVDANFMNLCEDLKNLAVAPAGGGLTDWNDFVSTLLEIIKNDVSPDFVAPTALALTRRCVGITAPTTVTGPDPTLPVGTSMGVTLTYS